MHRTGTHRNAAIDAAMRLSHMTLPTPHHLKLLGRRGAFCVPSAVDTALKIRRSPKCNTRHFDFRLVKVFGVPEAYEEWLFESRLWVGRIEVMKSTIFVAIRGSRLARATST